MIIGCLGCGQWIEMTRYKVDRPTQTTEWIHFNDKNYLLGETKTVFVGQPIIRITEYKQQKKTRLPCIEEVTSLEPLSIQFKYKLLNYKIESEKNEKGSIVEAISPENKKFYLVKKYDNYGEPWGIAVDDNGEIYKRGIYSYKFNMLYYPEAMIITPTGVKFLIKKTVEKPENIPLIKYELIYSGNSGVFLKLTYREFTGYDFAKVGFYQDLTYEGNEKQIRFKDFVIKIHDATNEKITYTVIADGLKE